MPDVMHRDEKVHGLQVLAVPLPRRPLFPGNIMPVSVQNPQLIKELLELKRSRSDKLWFPHIKGRHMVHDNWVVCVWGSNCLHTARRVAAVTPAVRRSNHV
jgi:ATP-dependent Lon protease